MERNSDLLSKIIQAGRKIDEKSGQIYKRFYAAATDDAMKDFWKEMLEGEARHVRYWSMLEGYAKEGMIPDMFENPQDVLGDLLGIAERMDGLNGKVEDAREARSCFLAACYMEFFMLHNSFIRMFSYLQSTSHEVRAADEYEEHLNHFIDGVRRLSGQSEFELFAETIQQIWMDNRQLTRQSTSDPLTALLNRRGFFQVVRPLIHMAQRGERNMAMLLVDIDHFKKINDEMGHQVGDRALGLMGSLLSRHVRRSDVVGRYGGEEFVICLPEIQPEQLRVVSEQIRASIERESREAGIPMTVSIGASQRVIKDDAEMELDRLIREADDSLYRAKSEGRNRTVMHGDR